ncbi:hypothetical protein MC7420_3557 [Coleofasciculus chthonoplastes PCC 7420]|uniref:Glycosyltransferase 2-like domain-containing protein n=1 Tax=Coleofasciculus chthonoplastes PCC 7420 TaxID=118168 RepID=B4VZW3_9CYAN|nr:glycosyltransferase [Coleofasciculus chthonoplastes]EDX72485.1 hypothetical protein MC7420_3557 [Coleofasciculus chthonoplastes PCC 7420]
MIYLLTVNYYSTQLIEKLIHSIPIHLNISYQIVIVNNSPDDIAVRRLHIKSFQILEANTNLGFGKACNLGLNWIYTQNSDAIVWMINPDTYLPENTLEKVFTFFQSHPEISILGTLIYTPSGDIWFAGGRFVPQFGAILSTDLLSSDPEATYIPSDWVSGCSLLLNLHHFKTCPQFDPAYFLYYEDFDFCRRYAMQGHRIAITSHLAVIHQPSSITNRNIVQKYKHSTYSYLLTLERYTNKWILLMRFGRLFFHTFILLILKPQTALGKLAGIFYYSSPK